jgi:type II secretory pathway component PulJ
MRQWTERKTSGRSGFTIVELLVATSVTVVLIGLMITMTNGVLTSWNRTSGTLTANNQAKLILDQVAQDLQASIFRYDPANPDAVWLAVEILDQWPAGGGHTVDNLRNRRGWIVPTEPQSQMLKPIRTQDERSYRLEEQDLSDCRYGVGGVWLRLFTNSTRGQNTAPAAVSYQIIRRHVTDSTVTPNPAEIRYMLYRSEVTGRDEGPLRYGYDLAGTSAGPGPGIGGSENAAEHYGDSLLPGRLINPRNGDIIANNVIDFGMRLYIREAGLLDPVFPTNFPVGFDFSNAAARYLADGSLGRPFPDVADVMVRILTEEGARQIQNLEAGRSFQNITNAERRRELWWDIAEANSRVFTRRVFLNANTY